MARTAGGGCDCRDRGIGDHELEEKLRPGVGIELRRPIRQRLAFHQLPEPGAAKRRIHQHRHAQVPRQGQKDRKSTRLNSSHVKISYAVFCLKKKSTQLNATKKTTTTNMTR